MHTKGNEIPRGIGVQEYLWAYIISRVHEIWKIDIPIALPTAQEIKVAATTVDFFVAPAMFRDTIDRVNVCADQNDSVI